MSNANQNTEDFILLEFSFSCRMRTSIRYFLAFLAYFIWGLTFPFAIQVMPPLSSYSFVFLRTLMGSIVLLIFLGIKREILEWFSSFRAHFKALFLFALGPFTFSYILQFYAIQFTSPINQSIIAQTSIIWVIVLNYFFFHQKPHLKFIIGVILAIIGVILLITGKGLTLSPDTIKGDLLSIIAFISWAAYSSFSKPISEKMPPLYSITSILLISTVILSGFAFGTGLTDQISQLSEIQWGIMIYLGIICTGLAYVLHLVGVAGEKVKTEYVVYTGFIMPVVSTIYSVIFLDKIFTNRMLLGGILIMFSAVIVQYQNQNKEQSSQENKKQSPQENKGQSLLINWIR
ncbi:MAG: DMT family transporter [Candidatus Lokiarchaeota archaeon]|nr:DMT family transporter [Candidatus Harpocratesius repetitus]